MTTKKIIQVLGTTLAGVSENSWEILTKLVDAIEEGKAIVREKRWADDYKEINKDYFPLDLSKMETWSTFDNGRRLYFYIENEELLCDAKIYSGNFLGERTDLKFSAKIKLDISFAKELEKAVLASINRLAAGAYEDYLEAQRKFWIHNFVAEILGEQKILGVVN